MRKGIKILGKVLSATLLTLIILPVVLSIVIDIPVVQNAVVHYAVRKVSDKLGTTVAIDRVDLSLLGKAHIEGFYVEDYQHDTLLYAKQLDAFITGLGIFGGGVELSRADIVGAKLYLRETPEGEMNIKQVVSRLSNPDKPKKGDFRLTLRQATIDGMDLCLERLNHREPPYGIDFGHMHLFGITAYVDDFTIEGPSIYTTIGRLSARERSGFWLDHFSGRFFLTSGCIGFEQAHIVTEQSNVTIPYISLVGNSWADYKEFIGEVEMNGALRNTTVSTDDVAYFAPKLRDWHVKFSNVNVEVTGVVSDFTGKIKSMQLNDGTFLTADATIKGLPDIRRTHFDLDIPHLRSSADEANTLARSIAGRDLPERVTSMLGNTGDIDISARFRGLLSSFDMQLGMQTGVGAVSCNLKMNPLSDGLQSVRGDVQTHNLKLGELLGKEELLGDATLSATVDGVVGRGYADANVVGDIAQLEFNGYGYDSIRLDGRLRNREFNGVVTARDANLDFDFSGLVNLNDSIPLYDFTLALRRADLTKLHINRRDSVSVLSARITAKAGGRSLDDMNGTIQVTDGNYWYNDKHITAENMTVTGANSQHSKFIQLRSDFADATFRSKTSYREIFDYLRQSAWKYLPLLRNESGKTQRGNARQAVANDYSLLSVNIHEFNPIADAVSSGLQIANGSTLQLLFNPASNQLSLKASSEYIERHRMLATRLNVNASNRGDSLTVYASTEDLYAGGIHLPELQMTGGARSGVVQVSAGFTDTMRKVSGLVGIRAALAKQQGPNGQVVEMHILPSHITARDKTWQIFTRKIELDTARIVIDHFLVSNNGQGLSINGIASRSREDSLTLRLHNFDLAPFTQIVNNMGYAIEGRTNGTATMKSALKRSRISADILLDSIAVNEIPAPPMRLTSRWDFARSRASITVTNREKQDTLIRGFFDPTLVRYYAKIQVDSLQMGLLDPILSGVISGTKGLASADLVLQGEHRNADLSGRIHATGLSTTVDFTQVTYTMPEATLDVKGNRFRATNIPVFDPDGNRGRFDLDLNLQHLSNISYEVRVAPQQMLVLNTTSDDNDYFYGRVFASGSARISGDKGNVRMDITATTDDNSTFSMPLSSKSNISYADFVTFEKPKQTDSLDNLAQRKKLFERQRRQKAATANQMDIALALNVRPNVEVELSVSGNTVKARGEGTLNLQINPRSNVFEMYGDYTLTEGAFHLSLLNLYNKKFTIESGSTIQWTGSPMDALLDIDAAYKLKTSLQPLLQGSDNLTGDRSVPVECIIHLGDRLTDPAITFNVHVSGSDPETQTIIANALSTPESVDKQFLSLLVFNSFMADNNATSSTNMGASVSAATGLEFLTNMLSNWLSVNDYNLLIRYRPKSDQTSDELDFGLSKSLINNRLFIEAEGNYLLDNKQAVNSSMSNFMGEAYITYYIDRAGALKFKAFTQTIDRFDENQGLQETGIGVYFKEDFDNFRDFRRRIKERFVNKKRQAARKARREAAANGKAEKAAEPANPAGEAAAQKQENKELK